nr:MAG TPA: portal protein [Caudoviricetes sp.]
MEESFGSRLKHAWNTLLNKDPTIEYRNDLGVSYSYRPDRPRLTRGNERSIITAIYNRISLDVASVDIKHVRLDTNERYVDTMPSKLNNCFSLEANIDQTGRALIQDIIISMLDEGVVAVVPIDTDTSIYNPGTFDIETMRTAKILEWYPRHVKCRVYNDRTGNHEEVTLPKSSIAIIENPFYSVMNEPNSTLKRLSRKLSLLDVVDEQTSSGKLDMIIQLPYIVKTEARRKQAEERRKLIEDQLAGSKYGIAYTDGTERITQLNRSVENNLMTQIEYLTKMLYSQLGITQSVLEGTADEKTMLNYYSRTIEPIISAVVDEFKRKFLTKTARTQRQSIMFFRDPFKLVPVSELAELSDKLTRNEIISSNEVRQTIGLKPSSDPSADELRNKNLNRNAGAGMPPDQYGGYPEDEYYDKEGSQNEV